MPLSKSTDDDKIVKRPNWCCEMGKIIDVETIADELRISCSEALRIALDDFINLKRRNRPTKKDDEGIK